MKDNGDDGSAGKRDGMNRAENHADEEWKQAVVDAIYMLAKGPSAFTTDEVWLAVGDDASTHEPRAMGPMIRNCVRAGMIVKAEGLQCSSLSACHRRPKQLWMGSQSQLRLDFK
jgi:hypothetical protein